MYGNKGIQAYKRDSLKSDLASASPHRIIQLLMQGILERVALGKGCIERKDFQGKSASLGRAIEIINSLRDALERDANPELVDNLDALYEYMIDRIHAASLEMNTEILDHVSSLMLEIKGAWDQIADA
ncbi:flagellar export chaperone FliS [Marinomonas balearica]|uniref:Flagellar secretion chaperone FliS n=1 Tax=Marinomonas balearica TaxID=491947 RepID=A0A4R6M5Y5_9GAMM|nr:flagellar export chaperone FliS [Marinomonas balearica]TDO96225.1 flagellar protein FliS [Marinomonas balearica]